MRTSIRPFILAHLLVAGLAGKVADTLAADVQSRTDAEKGEPTAQYALGVRLFRGLDGSADIPAAYHWFERAAEQGMVEAQLRLGTRYEHGIGCLRDESRAREWFRRAADKGDVAAYLAMARLSVVMRIGATYDPKGALDWARKAAEAGYTEAQFTYAQLQGLGGYRPVTQSEQQLLLEKAAGTGFPAAQRELGKLLMGSPSSMSPRPQAANHQHLESALFWFKLAENQGDTVSKSNAALVATVLMPEEINSVNKRVAAFNAATAKIVPASIQEAIYHLSPRTAVLDANGRGGAARFARLLRMAEEGDGAAQFQVALSFHLSDGGDESRAVGGRFAAVNGRVTQASAGPIPRRYVEAARWYRAAASNGVAQADVHLSYMAVNDQLETNALRVVVAHLQQQAAARNGLAQYQLAHLSLNGTGTPKDSAEGVRRLKLAAELGMHEAKRELAYRYDAGDGVPKDSAEGLRWLKQAAEAGLRDAKQELGARYYNGNGAPKDLGEAARWLRQAAQEGNSLAKRQLTDWFGQHVGGFAADTASAPISPTTNQAATGPVRLAVVPVAEALKPAADLIVAALSKSPQVTLLERDQIEKVIREQLLAADSNTAPLKLGQLLGADGVLLLDTNFVSDQILAGARLVAVRPGLVLTELQAPFPFEDLSVWATGIAERSQSLLGKLGVPREQAVFVSLLGLRAAINNAGAAELEQGLSRLFAARLAQERDVFVLERRQLERLSLEKEISGDAKSSFWSGSHLTEGSIDQTGASRDQLTVRLKLTSPNAAAVTLEASGARANLPALADALCLKLLAALKKTSSVAWQPETEAQRFLEQARWARRWRQWREAAAALEVTWALGVQGYDATVLRVESLAGSVQPVGLFWSATSETHPIPRNPPDPANIEFATRTLEAFAQGDRGPLATRLHDDKAWIALGAHALEQAGHVLQDFYRAAEYRKQFEDRLLRLRAAAKEVQARMEALPLLASGRLDWEAPPTFSADGNGRGSMLGKIFGSVFLPHIIIESGRYWMESPEEFLALHRKFIHRPDYPAMRGFFRSVDAQPTPLVAWNAAARPDLLKRWNQHWRTLTESPDGMERLEGLLFELERLPNLVYRDAEPQFAAALRRTLDASWELREPLVAGSLGSHSVTTLLAACRTRFAGWHGSTGGEEPGRRLEEIVAKYETRLREYQTAEIIRYLRSAQTLDEARFNRLVDPQQLTGPQIRELLPAAQEYSARFSNQPSLRGRLATLGTLANNVPPSPNFTPATDNSSHGPAANALRVTRFWLVPELRKSFRELLSFPLADDARQTHRLGALHQLVWRENQLWVAWHHELLVYLGRGNGSWEAPCSHIAPVALPDLREPAHPPNLPPEVALAREYPAQTLGKIFEVLDGALYLSGSNAVYRMSGSQATNLPLAVSGFSRLQAAHGRLIVSAADTILAYDPKSKAVKTLASSRRRPAENALDALESLGQPVVYPIADGGLRAVAGSKVFQADAAWTDWKELRRDEQIFRGSLLNPQVLEGETYFDGGIAPLLPVSLRLPHASEEWQFAAFRLMPPPNELKSFQSGQKIPRMPLWLPADSLLAPVGLPVASFSNLLFVATGLNYDVGGTNQNGALAVTNGAHMRLAVYRTDLPSPAVIPLWLEAPPVALNRGVMQRQAQHARGLRPVDDPGQLLAAGPGLVYRSASIAGFWFIPWAEILPRATHELETLASRFASRPVPEPKDRIQRLIHTYDANGDGKLQPVEIAVLFFIEKIDGSPVGGMQLQQRFNSADKNKDGALDREELVEFLNSSRGFGPGNQAGRPPFGPPGVLNPSQPVPAFPPGSAQLPPGFLSPEMLKKYDKNGNGKLDPEELQQYLEDRRRQLQEQIRAGEKFPPPVKP